MARRLVRLSALAALVGFLQTVPAAPRSELTSPVAVTYDRQGWTVDGRRVTLVSAEFDYARIARPFWKRRIALARAAGFNALTIPVYWGFHERAQGAFSFDGPGDLGALLELCRRQEMWAIARIGPYVSADWGLGGLPPYLAAQPTRFRLTDHLFRKAADRWYANLLELLSRHQRSLGGALIALEISGGEGAELVNRAYLEHLRRLIRQAGIELPVIEAWRQEPTSFRTARSAAKPPLRRAIVRLGRPRRWNESDVRLDRSATVAALLQGGVAWLDCRYFFGGTNFSPDAAENLAQSHDCGAPVGEAGNPRTALYELKRVILPARYAEGRDRPRPLKSKTGVEVNGASPAIEASSAPLIIADRGNTLYLTAEVPTGEQRTIRFASEKPIRFELGTEAFTPTSGGCELRVAVGSDGQPRDYRLASSGTIHAVALPPPLFARTWRLGSGDRQILLTGPDLLLDVESSPSGRMRIVVGSNRLPARYRLYCDDAKVATSRGNVSRDERRKCWIIETGPGREPRLPSLGRWRQRDDGIEALPSFDDAAWASSRVPLTIERLPAALASAYAWYRTVVEVPDFSTYTLRLGGIGDRAWVFLEGWRIGIVDGARTDEIMLVLAAGRSHLAFLTEHGGREGLKGKSPPVPEYCLKGLRPPARLVRGGLRQPLFWGRFAMNDRGPEDARRIAGLYSDEENWQLLPFQGPDDMNSRCTYAWYRYRVRAPKHGFFEIYLHGADDRAWVYLDGVLVGRHDRPDRGRLIRVPDSLPLRRRRTSHMLSVLVQNRSGPGGLTGPLRVGTTESSPDIRVGPWKMRVGLRGEIERWFAPPRSAQESDAWSDVTTPTRRTAVRWYRAHFRYGRHADFDDCLYFNPGGLRRGTIWLNGHRLGHYRNETPDGKRGIYLPSCWIERDNWIVVAETDGGRPDQASLTRDHSATCFLTTILIENP